MKNKPEQLWAFWANSHGPWNKSPKIVYWDEDLKEYYSKDGNSNIQKFGLNMLEGYISFADKDKKEVQKFINGFMACRELLSGFFK